MSLWPFGSAKNNQPCQDRTTAAVLDAIKPILDGVKKMTEALNALQAAETANAAAIAQLQANVNTSVSLLQQLHTDLTTALANGNSETDIQAIADKLATDTANLTASSNALAAANTANAEQPASTVTTAAGAADGAAAIN